VQDATEKLTPNRRHAAYKRFTSGFVVMVLIEENFEAGSARLIDTYTQRLGVVKKKGGSR